MGFYWRSFSKSDGLGEGVESRGEKEGRGYLGVYVG